MEGREQKRNSAKKHSDYAMYSKKAVRAKEALLEKQKKHVVCGIHKEKVSEHHTKNNGSPHDSRPPVLC